MKEIKAFIRPNKVNDIVHHLKDAGFENMTISSAEGAGKLQDENAFVFLFTPVDNIDWGLKVGAFIPLNVVLYKK